MKKKRLKKILELINKFDIENQDVLMKMLQKEGFNVTQATISRDIKELDLIKVVSEFGGYKYVERDTGENENNSKFISIFRDSVISVNHAGNMLILKSYSGMANAACAAIDSMSWKGVLGTIAGDDTIFAVCSDETTAQQTSEEISKLINI